MENVWVTVGKAINLAQQIIANLIQENNKER